MTWRERLVGVACGLSKHGSSGKREKLVLWKPFLGVTALLLHLNLCNIEKLILDIYN